MVSTYENHTFLFFSIIIFYIVYFLNNIKAIINEMNLIIELTDNNCII